MPALTPELQEQIRTNIRTFMKTKNIDYQELADRMGIQRQSANNLISKGEISEKAARRLSDALNYPYALLINGLPYLGETTLEQLERRIERIERMLNIKPE